MTGTAGSETRLIWPGLRGFYDALFEVAYALLRVTIRLDTTSDVSARL
jgi:hypothetical protein